MPAAKPRDPNELNTSTIAKLHSDEAAAWALMERIRWPDGKLVCPHCGVIGNAYFLEPKAGKRTTRTGNVTYRRVWKCGACRQQFSVLVGTIFEDSKIPLSKWLLAVHHLCAGKNGMSAHELARTLGITVKSAWHMGHRIRLAMQESPLREMLSGTVEADETYMGGFAKGVGKAHARDNKVPVFTLVERGGRARSQIMRNVTSANIGAVLHEQTIPAETRLMTDEFYAYRRPGAEMASHETVNHGQDEYARGDVTTNTVEGFFSQLKRSVDGTHHHVSAHHLSRYLGEFDFRYNTRASRGYNDSDRTIQAIRQAAGKRLTYRPTGTGPLLVDGGS